MEKDKKLADQNLLQFVEEVASIEKVWGLHCKEGWANADSHEFDDTLVYPFWSNKKQAEQCAVDEWSVFKPAYLELSEFLENWCIGMYKEYTMVGVNWETDLFGKEIEPIGLALLILTELRKQGKTLRFSLYSSQLEFEGMLKEVVTE